MQVQALSRYQDDVVPALHVIRSLYGQSQALAQRFGAKLIPQEEHEGLYFPEPCIHTAADVDRVKLIPLEQTLYYKAIEYARYAVDSTDGQLNLRNSVMTGPIDTANYILGSMGLMEWIHDEPKALHKLLQMITDTLIDTLSRLQKAAGGKLCPDCVSCIDRSYGLCSEVRHLMSAESVLEFETPYLKQIGEACGPYTFHACGTWERTLEGDMTDPNLMAINFQSKEMDLAKIYAAVQDRLSLSFSLSGRLAEQFVWPDDESYCRYVTTVFPKPVPMEFYIPNIEVWNKVQDELKGGPSGMFSKI
jgi:uroporphyrinogen-III decarboxylase